VSDRVNLRKFLSASSAALFMRATAAGVAFLLNVFVARSLGPSEAGLFFLGQLFLVILGTISRFGMDYLLVRFVSVAIDQKNPAGANGVLLNASLVTIPLSIVIATLCYLSADWISVYWYDKPTFTPILQAVAVSIVPFAIFQLFAFAIQGRSQIAWSVAIGTALFPGLILILAQMLRGYGFESGSSLMSLAVVAAILNAAFGFLLWMKRTPLAFDFSVVSRTALIASALPMFLSTLITLSNTWTPHLLLGAYVESDQIAMLSNAHKTAALVGFLLLAITSAAAPTYAALYSRNEIEGLRLFVARVNGVVIVATTPLLILLFAFSEEILAVFGKEFTQAAWLLRILVIGQVVNAIAGSVNYLLIMSGNERALRNTIAISGALGLLLSVLLIPRFGAMGAAVVLTVVIALSNLLGAIQLKSRLGFNVLTPDFRFLAALWNKARLSQS
jgi:O-antigen/teichoic acid export membrane protein